MTSSTSFNNISVSYSPQLSAEQEKENLQNGKIDVRSLSLESIIELKSIETEPQELCKTFVRKLSVRKVERAQKNQVDIETEDDPSRGSEKSWLFHCEEHINREQTKPSLNNTVFSEEKVNHLICSCLHSTISYEVAGCLCIF